MPSLQRSPKNNVKYSRYVGDDDCTTLAALAKENLYKLQKYSNIIPMKRSLSTRLYNLCQRMKFSAGSFILTQKVMNYLMKCFHIVFIRTRATSQNCLNLQNQLYLMHLVTTAVVTQLGADITQLQQPIHTYSGTPPYGHPVNTVTSIIRSLFFVPAKH